MISHNCAFFPCRTLSLSLSPFQPPSVNLILTWNTCEANPFFSCARLQLYHRPPQTKQALPLAGFFQNAHPGLTEPGSPLKCGAGSASISSSFFSFVPEWSRVEALDALRHDLHPHHHHRLPSQGMLKQDGGFPTQIAASGEALYINTCPVNATVTISLKGVKSGIYLSPLPF